MEILLLVVSFVVILSGAELFTNGIEWFGRKLNLGEGAVGSVLAAVGTALPETMIPFIAIVVGGGIAGGEVGVGAILGAPFMLATLAMFVTGSAVWAMRRTRTTGQNLSVNTGVLGHDMAYFAVAYTVAIGAALLPVEMEWPRRAVAVVLIGIYVFYVWGHLKADAEEHEELAQLRFHKFDRRAPQHPEPPRFFIVTVQVVAALLLIIVGAFGFVNAVEHISSTLALNATLMALVIAPVATELPEKLNSVLWVRRGKDTLAMGNITGAMVFQSALPPSIALIFAPAIWTVNGAGIAFLSAGIAFASSAAIFGPMMARKNLSAKPLLVGGLFYLAYLAVVIFTLVRG
jgi:cation:H+ antiporter